MKELRKSGIFKEGQRSWHRNALIGSYFSSDLRSYSEGYYLAAKLLVDKTDKGNPSNILVYPICFLYRHFIEIALKAIIWRCLQLGHTVKNYSEGAHNLETLLAFASDLTKKLFGSSFSQESEETIRELNNIDPDSQVFRYTRPKKGNHFFPEHSVIGLGTLKNRMSKVYDELLGTLIGLDEELDIQAQINQESAH